MITPTRLSPEELEKMLGKLNNYFYGWGKILGGHIAALEDEIRSLTPLSDERRKEIKKEIRKRLKEFKL